MTKTVNKALSLLLSLLMVLSMVSVFCLPAYAEADFKTAYDGTIISKNALLVTDKAYGKPNDSAITETWDGESYTFTVGVNAFSSLSAAFDYAFDNDIDVPDIIVANWDENKDLIVTASANIYAPNYATTPFNEDKTVNAATGTGKDWTENTDYMDNQVTVRNIVISQSVSGGTVKIAGFTFEGYIDDLYRPESIKATTITLENIMKDGNYGLSQYIIYCQNDNTVIDNTAQNDVFTVNNFYIKNTSTQALISSDVYAYTTFDGLWVDAENANMGIYCSIITQGADDSVFTIKNSNLRNFRRSDYNRNQTGLIYFEGRLKQDVYSGMSAAIVFDNNILEKFCGRSGGDASAHIIGWHANSYTDFTFTNNYFDHVSNDVTTAQGYVDTSRFFHTSIESYSNCERLGCYGTVTITGNTFNGCRLKFEITNNSKTVPFKMKVHDNFMVEDRTENLSAAIGGIPEIDSLHERVGKLSGWLDFARTKSSGNIHSYAFSDDVVADMKNKTITYSTSAADIQPNAYGDGFNYILDLSGIVKSNPYNNLFLYANIDILNNIIIIHRDRSNFGKLQFKMVIASPDATSIEEWTVNVEVSNLDICDLFSDVKHDSWYEDYVKSAYFYGLMNGTDDDSFKPDTTLSRAMTVTVIARIAGIDTESLRNKSTKFTDVPKDKWFTGAVAWAVENGITTGTGETTFSPNSDITRQDICVLLVRFADSIGIKLKTDIKKTKFTDHDKINKWATDAVYACQQAGIVNGNPDGSFNPRGNTKRNAAAKIFSIFYEDYILNK